jgi:trimeric autotransporter adhesin
VLIAGTTRATGTTCAYDSDDKRHECSITGTSVGTAKLTISNYATAALATAAANGAEVTGTATVVVSSAVPATVKIEFDKATYAPSERARIYVTPLDSSGKAMQVATYTNLFASGGISTASGLVFAGSTTTADSLTAVTITTKANSSAATGARAGSMEYTVFMPAAGGTVTLSATGGSGLPLAGRVAVTASATVTDSGAAALAAVNALATTVASLKTLITTLTNLVLKIQKKVKA